MKLYRLMKPDANGKPLIGSQFGKLGVRPLDPATGRGDVQASAPTEQVQPGEGGMSVFTDPAAIRLRSAGMVLFEIDTDDLPPELADVSAGNPHHHVEPSRSMTLADFTDALESTRDDWQPVT